MLIFVAGHYPIYGMQMLYFKDPVLRARAAMSPPATLMRLIEGKPLSQWPLERTPHMISHAGITGTAATAGDDNVSSSPMEQEFTAQLRTQAALLQSTSLRVPKLQQNRLPVPEAYLEELGTGAGNIPHLEKEL
jgi:hypothetical protein